MNHIKTWMNILKLIKGVAQNKAKIIYNGN